MDPFQEIGSAADGYPMPGTWTTSSARVRRVVVTAALAAGLVTVPAASALAAVTGVPTTLAVTGTVRLVVADAAPTTGPPSMGHVETLLAEVDGLPVPLPRAAAAGLAPGQQVRLRVSAPWGTSRADAVRALARATRPAAATAPPGAVTLQAVTADPAAARRAAAAPAVPRTSVPTAGSTHRLVLLPVWWLGSAPTSPTTADLRASAAQTASFWQTQSAGTMTVTTDVRAWKKAAVTSAQSAACDYSAIYAAALAANPGVVASSTTHVVVWFPHVSSCAWAGLGGIGWPVVWNNGYLDSGVTTHEFGHNFGLGHANSYQCVDPGSWQISLSHTCGQSEYGDSSDVMGWGAWASPKGDVNAAEADYLGFLRAVDVNPATLAAPVTVTLAPVSDHDAVRAVRVPLPVHSPDLPTAPLLYVEYRTTRAYGADWRGVQVHVVGQRRPWTWLLALRPDRSRTISTTTQHAPGWADPTLPVGSTWQVPGTTLRVRVDSQTATTARVTFALAGQDVAPPSTVTLTAPAQGGTLDRGGQLVWGAAADDASGVAQYRVVLDGVLESTVTAGTTTFTLPELAVGTHTARVDAVDGAGHVARGTDRAFVVAATGVAAPSVAAVGAVGGWVRGALTLDVGSDARFPTEVLLDGRRRVLLEAGDTDREVALGTVADGRHVATVRTLSENGRRLRSASATVTVDRVAPAAPAALRARQVNADRTTVTGLRVAWGASTDAGSGVGGYTVDVDGVRVATTTGTAVTVPAAALTGARLAGHHSVVVTARDRAGRTARATRTVLVDTTRPAAPTVSARVVDARHVALTFTASSDPQSGLAGYQVLRAGGAYGALLAAGRSRYTTTVAVPVGTTTVGVEVLNRAGLHRVVTVPVTTR